MTEAEILLFEELQNNITLLHQKVISYDQKIVALNQDMVERDQKIAEQGQTIRYLDEQLDWFKRQIFGKKSERIISDLNYNFPYSILNTGFSFNCSKTKFCAIISIVSS